MKPPHNVAAAAALALMLAACGNKGPEWVAASGETLPVDLGGGAGAAAKDAPVPVEAARVRTSDMETGLNASGNILPWESVLLSPKLPGKLRSVAAEEGASVQAGDLLAELDTEDLSIELSRAKSEAGRATSRLARVKKLYKAGAATIGQLEAAQSAEKEASSALKVLAEKMASARLTAPFAGVVSRKLAAAGSVAAPGQPVLELVDISKVRIDAGFSEVEARHLSKGCRARVSADAYPDRVFEGEVYYVGSVVDPVTRTFSARVTIDNREGLLKAGMSAKVRIVTGSFAGAMSVPALSLIKENGRTYVYVLAKSGGEGLYAAARREVDAGLPDGDSVHVRAGLQKDDLVAARGAEKLSDGARARIVDAGH